MKATSDEVGPAIVDVQVEVQNQTQWAEEASHKAAPDKGQDEFQEKQAPDVWNVVEFTTTEAAWRDKTGKERVIFVLTLFFKSVLALGVLYLFIVSLGLMANSFRILGGKSSGRAFRDTELFNNPLAGLVTGIIVTVLVQSSSTSTSIIITMTAGDLIKVKNAIFMIMGANIGTSVTNTLVSLGSFGSRDEYRRAFAGATVHDCFNFLCVLMLLPIEAITGFLYHMANGILSSLDVTDKEEKGAKTDFLKKLTKPAASPLLGIDKKLITKIAQESDLDKLKKYDETSIIKHQQKDDNHIFMDTPMSDGVAGVLMVFVSLMFLCICLMLLVKLLQTIFRGRIAIWFRQVLNLEFESVPGLANYVLIAFGIVITILFQSSSVTTSTLTPLVGIGLVRLDKMFAFTIGANVGTTVTGVLSALVSDKRKTGLTVALAHVLFNVIGALIWYPIPWVRSVPISSAKTLGNIAADWRWFPIAYIFIVFAGLPLLLLGLSVVSPWLCVFLGVPLLIAIFATFGLIGLRNSKPHILPAVLQKDASWFPNAVRVNKLPEAVEATTTNTATGGMSADLGANNWHAAPAAWGTGWFVVLVLLAVCFNSKWADMKYTSWDKRNHYGIGAWSSCSYAFKEDMPWAGKVDESGCDLELCGAPELENCKDAGFSSTGGAYKAYEASWSACRSNCLTLQWQAWCEKQNCGGNLHTVQCQNITNAVHRPYKVIHGKEGENAWTEGDLCRDVSFLCTGVDGQVKVSGDLSVAGLVFAIIGQSLLLTYSMKLNLPNVLIASALFFVLAWIMLLASFGSFTSTLDSEASCIVEDEHFPNKAVIASGRFGDIINGSGSYTYGFVIGAWLLLFVTIPLVFMRIVENRSSILKPVEKSAEANVEPAPKPNVEPTTDAPKLEAAVPEPDDESRVEMASV